MFEIERMKYTKKKYINIYIHTTKQIINIMLRKKKKLPTSLEFVIVDFNVR